MVYKSFSQESVNTEQCRLFYCVKILLILTHFAHFLALKHEKLRQFLFTFPFLVQCNCHAHAYWMCLVWRGTAACHWISIYYKLMLIEYNCSAVSNVHWLSKFVKLVWSLIVIMTVLGGWLDHSRMARNIMLCHYLKLLSATGGCSPLRLFVSHC